jgi:hypothetical protein
VMNDGVMEDWRLGDGGIDDGGIGDRCLLVRWRMKKSQRHGGYDELPMKMKVTWE